MKMEQLWGRERETGHPKFSSDTAGHVKYFGLYYYGFSL